MESYPIESNNNTDKEKLLYDINNSNNFVEGNDYCPHIFDHFINPYMNSIFKKITISSISDPSKPNNKPKKYDTIYSHNLSLFQNTYKSHMYLSYLQSINIFNSFLLKNISLDNVLYSNPQNLPMNSINVDGGCIFSLTFNDIGNIMTASNPLNLEIWDITKKRLKKLISDHNEIVTDVSFLHGDQNYSNFLSCSLDKTIKLYKNFECICTLNEHNDWVRAINISYDNNYFLSGCVSSVVKLWDLNKKIVIGNIKNQMDNENFMNTVNSLCFMRNNPHLFIIGLRSGDIKFCDSRINSNNNSSDNICIYQTFKAHNEKLNTSKLNQTDNYILTSGRDSTLRLWDIRKIPKNNNISNTNDYNHNFINEYKKHKCTGYNVECNFYNDEKYLITGSETGSIFIYDIMNNNNYKEIKTHLKCVNLVKQIPNHSNAFAFAGLAENSVFIYGSIKNISKIYTKDENISSDEEKYDFDDEDNIKQDKSQEICNNIIEEIMKEHGDIILKTFHENNMTYNSRNSSFNLMDLLQSNENNKLSQMFKDIFLNKIMKTFSQYELNGKNVQSKEKEKNKKTEKKVESAITKNEIKCYECKLNENKKEQIIKNEDNNIFNSVDKEQLKQLLFLPNHFEFNILNEF